MRIVPRFQLALLFKLQSPMAVLAFGLAVAKTDAQTGIIIALYTMGLTLAFVFLQIPRPVWAGMAVGCLVSVIWYWWRDTYHEVAPADRMFEFVISAVSVFAGAAAFAVQVIRR